MASDDEFKIVENNENNIWVQFLSNTGTIGNKISGSKSTIKDNRMKFLNNEEMKLFGSCLYSNDNKYLVPCCEKRISYIQNFNSHQETHTFWQQRSSKKNNCIILQKQTNKQTKRNPNISKHQSSSHCNAENGPILQSSGFSNGYPVKNIKPKENPVKQRNPGQSKRGRRNHKINGCRQDDAAFGSGMSSNNPSNTNSAQEISNHVIPKSHLNIQSYVDNTHKKQNEIENSQKRKKDLTNKNFGSKRIKSVYPLTEENQAEKDSCDQLDTRQSEDLNQMEVVLCNESESHEKSLGSDTADVLGSKSIDSDNFLEIEKESSRSSYSSSEDSVSKILNDYAFKKKQGKLVLLNPRELIKSEKFPRTLHSIRQFIPSVENKKITEINNPGTSKTEVTAHHAEFIVDESSQREDDPPLHLNCERDSTASENLFQTQLPRDNHSTAPVINSILEDHTVSCSKIKHSPYSHILDSIDRRDFSKLKYSPYSHLLVSTDKRDFSIQKNSPTVIKVPADCSSTKTNNMNILFSKNSPDKKS